MADTTIGVWPRWRGVRSRAFEWRSELPVAARIGLAFCMAGVTGLSAQVRVPLPFTPVPFTGQVFAVLLAGVLLGRYYGALSQLAYVGLGVAGVPWGTAGGAGIGWLLGPTGGYLIGFVLAAELIGQVSDRHEPARRFWPQVGLMMLGVAVIYTCGTAWLAFVLHAGPAKALALGAAPFIVGDAAKALVAAAISTAVLPKRP